MMRQDEELWVKKMKEVLSGYSESPPQGGWNKLEKNMNPVEAKRVRPAVWWISAAAAVLLAISGISLFLLPTTTIDDIRPTMPPILASTPNPVPDSEEPERTAIHHRPMANYRLTAIDPAGEPNDPGMPVIQPGIPAQDTEEVQVVPPVDDRRVVRPSGKDKLHLPPDQGKKSTKGRWALSASVSNAPGTTDSQQQTYLLMANMATSNVPNEAMIAVASSSLVFDGGVPYLKETATISEIKHKQPVSFGLSVRRNLGHGFSVESGVVYTMLSSDGKSILNESEKIVQTLHYIGVPVRGSFDFIDTKRFMVYATAGGMIERCVYGKIGSVKHTVKPLQFSLSGGVGAQLKLSNRIGVYIEPGISYFFDDGSSFETIRKENPLNFNFQAGIRFTY